MTDDAIPDSAEAVFKQVADHVLDRARRKAEIARAMADDSAVRREQVVIDTVHDVVAMAEEALRETSRSRATERYHALLDAYLAQVDARLAETKARGARDEIVEVQIRRSLVAAGFAQGTFRGAIRSWPSRDPGAR